MNILARLLPLGALAAASCFAQFDSATVLGTVHDPTGSVIANAKITLRNVATAVTATTTTNAAGNYEFLTVKIGDYTIKAEANGFSALTTETFNVAVNARQRVDVTLTVGSATESITVTGAAALVETDSSDKGQVVNGELIGNMPLYHINVDVGKAPEYVSIKPTNTVMPSNLLVVQLEKGSFVQCCHSPVKVLVVLCSHMLIRQIDSSCDAVFIDSYCFHDLLRWG